MNTDYLQEYYNKEYAPFIPRDYEELTQEEKKSLSKSTGFAFFKMQKAMSKCGSALVNLAHSAKTAKKQVERIKDLDIPGCGGPA